MSTKGRNLDRLPAWAKQESVRLTESVEWWKARAVAGEAITPETRVIVNGGLDREDERGADEHFSVRFRIDTGDAPERAWIEASLDTKDNVVTLRSEGGCLAAVPGAANVIHLHIGEYPR